MSKQNLLTIALFAGAAIALIYTQAPDRTAAQYSVSDPTPTPLETKPPTMQLLPPQDSNLELWKGVYSFSESIPPNPAPMVMIYEIAISAKDAKYTAEVNVSGQTTAILVAADVRQTGKDTIGLFFKSDRPGNKFTAYKPGDLLLQLQKLPNQQQIQVVWGKITPLVSAHRSGYIPPDLTITNINL